MNNLSPIGNLLKKSFQIYKKKFWLLVSILSINLPFLVVSVLSSFYYGNPGEKMHSNIPLFIALGILFLIVFLVGTIVALWSQLSIILLIKETDSNLNAKQYLALGWSKLNSYLWVYFLMGIISLAGFILLIIPGIIFYIWFVFSPYVFAVENVSGEEALKRSRKLVKNYWWSVFLRIITVGLLISIVSLVEGWIPIVGPLVGAFFVVPFWIIYLYLIYEDLKRIKATV